MILFVEGGAASGNPVAVNSDRPLDADGGAAHGTGLKLVAQIAAPHGGNAELDSGPPTAANCGCQ